jgi:hypothetical protein
VAHDLAVLVNIDALAEVVDVLVIVALGIVVMRDFLELPVRRLSLPDDAGDDSLRFTVDLERDFARGVKHGDDEFLDFVAFPRSDARKVVVMQFAARLQYEIWVCLLGFEIHSLEFAILNRKLPGERARILRGDE